ncbi:MAG: amidohydrolase family protein, partial [Anaerotignum sp.]|nr:amidohydrolase family protein [Anaerotignum sp.]
MKIYKGAILTCDQYNSVYNYLVEHEGIIRYVGNSIPEELKDEPIIDLGKKALIPAFADTHIHFASFAAFHSGLNVMEAKSNTEILDMLKAYVKTSRNKLIIGFGASPYSVTEGKLVSREELDKVCPDKPLFLVKYDGHACVVNTKLLEKIRKKAEHLRGFHADTGEMYQEAFFAVSDYVTNSIPIPQLLKNMQNAVDYLASKGIGLIHSVSGVGFTRDLDVD